MANKEQFNLRLNPKVKEKLVKYVEDNNCDNMTDLITEAILEKIDPEVKMRELKRLLLALKDDPDIGPLISLPTDK
jgi:predicted house-cleaning noncanonical NTP pyrophosphatase (MazG superfamily)